MAKAKETSISRDEYELGLIEGQKYLESMPKAVNARYDSATKRIVFEMESGITCMVPVNLVQGLQTDDDEALKDFDLHFSGTEIHWNRLDVQFTVNSLINGRFGTQKWMTVVSEHLAQIGRKGGRATTAAKRAASAANGKKGGRPRKSARPELATA